MYRTYVRFNSVNTNELLSDILSKSCVLYYHNKALKELTAFFISNRFVYVKTILGIRGVHINSCYSSIVTGEQIELVDHIPNLTIEKCQDDVYYRFKVGKKYVKICQNGTIVLSIFRVMGTKFKLTKINLVECDERNKCNTSNCFLNFITWSWIKNICK